MSHNVIRGRAVEARASIAKWIRQSSSRCVGGSLELQRGIPTFRMRRPSA